MRPFTLQPIGHLRTPYPDTAACPRNPRQDRTAPLCEAVVEAAYQPGLAALESFSHLILLYWLHEAPPPELVFTPPFDSTPRGILATRAPWRPNPIGLAVVAFEGLAGPGVLRVRHLDAVNGTPLLDIKPYLPTIDAEPAASMGWLAPHATR